MVNCHPLRPKQRLKTGVLVRQPMEAPLRLARMIQAVDAHACDKPGRVGVVFDGPGATMFDTMCHLCDHGDGLLAFRVAGISALCYTAPRR